MARCPAREDKKGHTWEGHGIERRCTHCGLQIAAPVVQDQPHPTRVKRGRKKGQKVYCSKCGQPGHYRKTCTHGGLL